MPTRNRKGQYVKHRKSHAITKYRTRTVTKYRTRKAHRKHRRGRRRHHAGGVNLTKIALAGLGLAFLTGAKSPIQAIPTNIAKIPGAKTFGNAATGGLICLGIDRFVKRSPWLRAAGIVGVVLGATGIGDKGTDFKWVGDETGDEFTGDIDVGDDDDIGDEVGDDE